MLGSEILWRSMNKCWSGSRLAMLSDEEKQTAHDVLAHFFDRPVRDMGGGFRIVELPRKWMDVKDVDLIKKAVAALLANERSDG